ncbi:MAG: hypothetical protein B6244_12675, partial [Candidatus Cloacimonetes bacterium 4572_55]
ESSFGIFQKETQILRDVKHEFIINMVDSGLCPINKVFYLITEFIPGKSFAVHLKMRKFSDQGKRLNEALKITDNILIALNHLHTRDILHNDIKPSNIIVEESGFPRLLDFGISRILETITSSEEQNFFSPTYASPEQIKRERITRQTDFYQLGITLLEGLCEKSEFLQFVRHKLPLSELIRKVSQRLCQLPQYNHEVSEELNFILHKAIQSNISERFKTAREFRNDIISLQHSLPFQPTYEKFLRRGVIDRKNGLDFNKKLNCHLNMDI